MTFEKNPRHDPNVCAGNGCSNPGTHSLTVVYLNKIGWFCEFCKNELVQEGLVMENKIIGQSTSQPSRVDQTHEPAATITKARDHSEP